jgi:hypothetical protein
MPSYLLNDIIDLLPNNKRNKGKRHAVSRIISTKITFIPKAAFT